MMDPVPERSQPRFSPDLVPDAASLSPRRRRLLFRANHRGTYEADLLVGGYVAARIAACDEATLDQLDALMDLADTDLADWLTGRRPIPEQPLSPLLADMREAALRFADPR